MVTINTIVYQHKLPAVIHVVSAICGWQHAEDTRARVLNSEFACLPGRHHGFPQSIKTPRQPEDRPMVLIIECLYNNEERMLNRRCEAPDGHVEMKWGVVRERTVLQDLCLLSRANSQVAQKHGSRQHQGLVTTSSNQDHAGVRASPQPLANLRAQLSCGRD